MEMNRMSERLTEVYAILCCLSEDEKNRIPQKVWKEIEKKRSHTYKYSYTKGDELILPDDTLAMLCEIRLRYLKTI